MAASESKINNEYLSQLINEKNSLNPQCTKAIALLQQEIERVRSNDDSQRKDNHIEIHTGKLFRLRVKVHIPVDEHPNFNFVGKLLGPKGSSLQQLQEATHCKMAILGRGSMRDKRKEEEFRSKGDPKYSHLNEDLHVEITAYASPPEAYRRISAAIAEIQPFLVPDGQQQPYGHEQEYFDDMRGQFDGKPMAPPPHMMGRGGPPPQVRPPPPLMSPRENRRPAPVQSTYAAPEAEDWSRPAPSPRRGGYAPVAPRATPRTYDEGNNDYNNYGDNYGEYNSGNNAYYDYSAETDGNYGTDDYGTEQRTPLRNAGGGAGVAGRNSTRLRAHPYAPSARRGGY